MAHFFSLVTIEIGKREDQKVGPMSFTFLLSTAKKEQRNDLIIFYFLFYPYTIALSHAFAPFAPISSSQASSIYDIRLQQHLYVLSFCSDRYTIKYSNLKAHHFNFSLFFFFFVFCYFIIILHFKSNIFNKFLKHFLFGEVRPILLVFFL
jgi:hypothetical protein